MPPLPTRLDELKLCVLRMHERAPVRGVPAGERASAAEMDMNMPVLLFICDLLFYLCGQSCFTFTLRNIHLFGLRRTGLPLFVVTLRSSTSSVTW